MLKKSLLKKIQKDIRAYNVEIETLQESKQNFLFFAIEN